MDLGSFFSTALSGITGGITGVIGTFVSSFVKYKTLKLQYEHEEKLKQLDMDAAKLKTELQIKLAQAQVQGELQKADAEIYKESYNYMSQPLFKESYFDKLPDWLKAFKGFVDTVIDALRAAIRPVLTIWFVIIATWLSLAIFQTDPKSYLITTQDLVATILYLTSTIVTWWFGNRDSEKFVRDILKRRYGF